MRRDEDFLAHPRKASVLLERDAELARLRAHLEAATTGHGGMAAVIGPAGIGKSSLLAATREAAVEGGSLILEARGGELERDYGFGVARQLFERVVTELPAARRRTVLKGAAARAAPVVGAGESHASAEFEDSYAVLHGLYWLTAGLSQRVPCVMVVDDLHWADAASLRFLAYLQRRLESHQIAVVVASRPAIESPDPVALERVIAAPGVASISPPPLSEQAVEALLAAVIERGEDELVRSVFDATGGNPFLCRLAVAGIAEGRNLTTDSSAELITRRIGPLDEHAETLVRAVAVLGTDVPLRRASALAGMDETTATIAADSLAARGIFVPGAVLEFTHPLVREGVRERIPAMERAQLHARAAELLRAEGAPGEVVAVHVLAAPSGAPPGSVQLLRDAARSAAAKGDPTSTATYLRRALAEPLSADERVTVQLELGEAELRAGDMQQAIEHLEEAQQRAGRQDERLRNTRLLALALMSSGRYEPAVELLRDAVDRMGAEDPELGKLLEGELYQGGMMLPATYQEVSRRLEGRPTDLDGDTPGERSLLTAFATEACMRGETAERVRRLASRAFERGLLDDSGPFSVRPSSSVWGNAAFPLIFAEGFPVIEQVVQAALERGAKRSDPIQFVRALTVSALLRMKQGLMREAEADARRAIELGSEIGSPITLMATWPLAEALIARGAIEEADDALALTSRADSQIFMAAFAELARARVRFAEGRLDEAIGELRMLQEREAGWRSWNPAMFPYRSLLAIALWRTGEVEEARDLAAHELELAQRWGAPGTLAASLRTLGMVSEQGGELLRQSVAVAETSGAQLEHAESLYQRGAAARREGRRAEAREPLYAAMEKAHRYGATVLAAQAREELVATGARPRRAVRTGVDALTPSERRVAQMAAAGMTNPAIAQDLFVTVRTVQVHLTNCYRKLDIASRKELRTALESQSPTAQIDQAQPITDSALLADRARGG